MFFALFVEGLKHLNNRVWEHSLVTWIAVGPAYGDWVDMSEMDAQKDATGRPFVGIHLKCCNVYVRAYLNAQKNAFTGWCPRCASQIRINVVAEGGSTDRFFEAS